MISQKNFNAMIEEKLLKIDDLAWNVDRIALDVDSLKLRSIPPKHDINESLKAMIISIDECKERTTRLSAKKYCIVKACSSGFRENNDESMDVNFVGRNNFGDNAYRGNFNPRPYPSNSSNNYGNSYNNSYGKMPSEFETSVKEFMNSQRISMLCLKKNCLRLMNWLEVWIELLLMLIL